MALRRTVGERFAQRRVELLEELGILHSRAQRLSEAGIKEALMDSVCWIDEMRSLASIAVHFTYAGDGPWTWPTRDEPRAFVADYQTARGRAFTPDERARLDAGAIYALAYTARCQYGADGSRREACDALAVAPDAYF